MSLAPFAPEIWTTEAGPLPYVAPPFPGRFPYMLRSVVVRLGGDGGLWVWSPTPLSPGLRAEVEALGPVRHLVSPNKLHHLSMGAWSEAFPGARLYASPGLARKRRDLRFAATLTDREEEAWAGEIEQCLVRGSWFMEELLFFHRATGTLLVCDLIENHDAGGWPPLMRALGRWNRMVEPGETPRNYRATFWRRGAARASLQKALAWPVRHVVVAHGPVVRERGAAFFRRGLGWLVGPAG